MVTDVAISGFFWAIEYCIHDFSLSIVLIDRPTIDRPITCHFDRVVNPIDRPTDRPTDQLSEELGGFFRLPTTDDRPIMRRDLLSTGALSHFDGVVVIIDDKPGLPWAQLKHSYIAARA
jgi:hypothetical protein